MRSTRTRQPALRQASTPLINWRQKRNLSFAIMIVRGDDEQLALEMYNALDDEKLKKQVTNMWSNPDPHSTRSFFWTVDA